MNDSDNQPDVATEFDADAAENYIVDTAEAVPDAIGLGGEETEARARLMHANLDQSDLDEEDLALLAGESALADFDSVAAGLPVLAVVGRPSTGRSTLVNRILDRREAIVQDTPGVTRDRASYPAEWAGRDFTPVDIGGWKIDVKGLDRSVARQAEIAVDLVDTVVFVLDATAGVTASDERIMEMLRVKRKSVILAASKVDSPLQEADATYLWSLGLGESHPISTLHGRGAGDLLDAAMGVLPTESAIASALLPGGPCRAALVGRSNVGKSSLLNTLADGEHVVVNESAGTAYDPVDELIELDGRSWRFVDIAGICHKMRRTTGADHYAFIRTQAAIEKAEVTLVLIDGPTPLTEQDVRIVQQIINADRVLVVVTDKQDLVGEDRQKETRNELERGLVQIQWMPRVSPVAKTGQHTNRTMRALDTALEG